MEAASDFAQLELRFVGQLQWRYELIRPLVLFENRPATQRAQETHTHPETVRKLRRLIGSRFSKTIGAIRSEKSISIIGFEASITTSATQITGVRVDAYLADYSHTQLHTHVHRTRCI